MKKLVRTIAMILLGTSLFATTVFAAETDTPTEQIQSLETQIATGDIPGILSGSSSKGEIRIYVLCSYSGRWDEGYCGWVDNATFHIVGATVNKAEYVPIPDGHLRISGSSAYQDYTVNGVSVTLSVTIDEWGDASLGMAVN